MSKIFQEFYCTKSGGGCGGYVLVKLNEDINGVVEVICPKCKHAHRRIINKGILSENGRFIKDPSQTIEPTIAAYSETPRINPNKNERESSIPSNRSDFLDTRLFELYGGDVCRQQPCL